MVLAPSIFILCVCQQQRLWLVCTFAQAFVARQSVNAISTKISHAGSHSFIIEKIDFVIMAYQPNQ